MVAEYGLLLPHFGEHAARDKIIEGSQLAEQYGFDSVWVRDHLAFEPHGEMEKPNRDFYDALITLSVVGATTERIKLGTGSLIPFRHPLVTALTVATMTQLLGPRVILGFGAGTFDHEFEAVGLGGVFRPDLLRENTEILRRVWEENDVSYQGEHYSFEGVNIEPRPAGHIPIWYCGNTPASARRAVDYCEGWMPGRINRATFRKRVRTIEERAAEQGKPRPSIAVIPPTSVERTREEALAEVNVEGLLAWANKAKYWVKPPSGRFQTWEDLEGTLIAGTPDDVVEECRKFEEAGNDHLVFDFRFKFDRFFEQIKMIGEEVLPRLRGA